MDNLTFSRKNDFLVINSYENGVIRMRYLLKISKINKVIAKRNVYGIRWVVTIFIDNDIASKFQMSNSEYDKFMETFTGNKNPNERIIT
jgi:hypothetical protein